MVPLKTNPQKIFQAGLPEYPLKGQFFPRDETIIVTQIEAWQPSVCARFPPLCPPPSVFFAASRTAVWKGSILVGTSKPWLLAGSLSCVSVYKLRVLGPGNFKQKRGLTLGAYLVVSCRFDNETPSRFSAVSLLSPLQHRHWALERVRVWKGKLIAR